MKLSKICSILFVILITSSCVRTLPDEDTRHFRSENEWIYDVMKNNYLFRNDMPTKPDFSLDPESFYISLLSDNLDINKKKTTHYSRIETKKVETKATNTSMSYGFECVYYKFTNKSIPRILYVIPGSPAEKAGLRRGDYIFEIDNAPAASGNLLNGNRKTLLVSDNLNSEARTVILEAAVQLDNKPLYMCSVINSGTHKIAYLVYNHFTPGIGDDPREDRRYDDELCALSRELSAQGVNEMVLDLRYNGGGQISCAQLLATMIAPASAMGKIFCTLKDVNNKIETYRFGSDIIRNGVNLNLKRLYVLTTEFSASASELVINSLRPYMDVIIIGDVTEGKNIGSRDFKHADFPHILKPIFCYVYNVHGKADYDNGFEPNYYYRDFDETVKQYSLGDPREAMLKIALGMINGTKSSTETKTMTKSDVTFRPIKSGIVIDTEQ